MDLTKLTFDELLQFRETRQRQVDEFNDNIKQTSQLLAEHVFGFTIGDLIEDRHGIKYIAQLKEGVK